ncbi:ARM repeat-containing protein [Linderina pennispora]|uniref:ARM repeat-containing protein n=1 Tax=Linderina pennispora TaxID=61395 RepID=A0A1Y1W8K1_9FUNG|nr:ARM repeat-containing protein [Linderina pennispora]ORX69861.1 ARM repeat-containing protein [Linderina pennispora]
MKPRFKELYKHTPTGREVRQRRLSHEAQLRRSHREQLFMGKRLRYRLTEDSETESEYEFTPSDTAIITRGLKSTNKGERLDSLKNLSTKLEHPSEELRRFVSHGDCIDLLLKFISATETDEKLLSVWCLTNIAANESALAEKILPATPHLITLISSDNLLVPASVVWGQGQGKGDPKLQELVNQAVWTLGNLAAENEEMREHLFASGALKPLVELADTTTSSKVLQTACFALSNMARRPNSFFDELFALNLHTALASQLAKFKSDKGCVKEISWVYAYLAASSSESQVNKLLASGAIEQLLDYAGTVDPPDVSLIPIIRTLGNIVAGTDAQTHAVVRLPQFVPLIVRCIKSSNSRAVEKESLWVLSSVTATKPDIDAFVSAGIVDELTKIVETQNFDIRKEAAFSLLNIAIAGQRLEELPNERLVSAFVEFIKSQDQELVRLGTQYLQILLTQIKDRQGVELLKNVTGGIDALENAVAVSEDDDVRTTGSALIDIYYGEDSTKME